MRQIKFRVWDGEKIVYPKKDGWFHDCKCDGYAVKQTVRLDTAIEKLTVMQFTGRKDMDGNDLYESDIVLFNGQKMEVRWDTNRAGFVLAEYNHPIYDDNYLIENSVFVEIIGNIYENPDLLK